MANKYLGKSDNIKISDISRKYLHELELKWQILADYFLTEEIVGCFRWDTSGWLQAPVILFPEIPANDSGTLCLGRIGVSNSYCAINFSVAVKHTVFLYNCPMGREIQEQIRSVYRQEGKTIYTLFAIHANRHQKRAANAAMGNKIWQTLAFKDKPIAG